MNDPNDDLASKVELALKIVALEKEVAELKRRLDPVKPKSEPYLPPVVRDKPIDDGLGEFLGAAQRGDLEKLLHAQTRRINQKNFEWRAETCFIVAFFGGWGLFVLYILTYHH
jgi:hypothetical protein